MRRWGWRDVRNRRCSSYWLVGVLEIVRIVPTVVRCAIATILQETWRLRSCWCRSVKQ
jgi:hypothetical protein